MKIIPKALFTAMIVAYVALYNHSGWVVLPLAALLFVVWFIDTKYIKSIMLEGKRMQLEMQETANQVAVTAERFDRVTASFADFSLKSLQIQGRLTADVDWQSAARFVGRVVDMRKESPKSISGTEIKRAINKVSELFKTEMIKEFPELRNVLEASISIESRMENGTVVYSVKKSFVSLKGLSEAASFLQGTRRLKWQEHLDSFQQFYTKATEDA